MLQIRQTGSGLRAQYKELTVIVTDVTVSCIYKHKKNLNVGCVMMLYVFFVVLCVSFCTGHFVKLDISTLFTTFYF